MRKLLGSRGKVYTAFLAVLIIAAAFAPECRAQLACLTPPVIASVSPSVWAPGQTIVITISGSNLFYNGGEPEPCADTSVTVGDSTGLVETSTADPVDPTLIYDTVTVPSTVPAESACVFVWAPTPDVGVLEALPPPPGYLTGNPCTGNSWVAAFPVQISASGPMITSVTPLGWWASKKQDITITGSGFLTSADSGGPSKVTASATGVTLKNVQVVSSTQITANVDVAKDAPAETVTLTVTNAANSSLSGSATASPAPVVLPVPQIQWNNQTISGESAQPPSPGITVSEPVNLTTLPSSPIEGIAIAKSEWKLGEDAGVTVDGWSPSTGKTVAPKATSVLDQTSLNTFWVYPKTDAEVKYRYCVDPSQTAPGPACSDTVVATFDVDGPGDGQMTTEPQDLMSISVLKGPPCFPITLEYWLQYGHWTGWDADYCSAYGEEHATPGITFTSPPGSSSGTYSFVQVLTRSRVTYFEGSAGHVTCPINAGVDGTYPYPSHLVGNETASSDSPSVPLEPILSSVRRDFRATMYMMWTANQSGSIAVPISSQSWLFTNASTTNSGFPTAQNWSDPTWIQVGLDGDPIDYVATAPGDSPYGYPSWLGPATQVAKKNCPQNASNDDEEN